MRNWLKENNEEIKDEYINFRLLFIKDNSFNTYFTFNIK